MQAHAFGARYDLPLPLDLYMIGAAAAVVLSPPVMAVVFRAKSEGAGRWRFDLLRFAPARALLHPFLRGLLQTIGMGFFALVLAAGFFGSQDTIRNFAPTFVWFVWWVGSAYVAALLGNLWPQVNPWYSVFAVWERLRRRLARPADLGLFYPPWLGAWPAVLLFGLFSWLELISETARVPASLASAVLLNSLVTWAGMAAFRRQAWLAKGEAFSLAFGVLGRFAPLEAPISDPFGFGWDLFGTAGYKVDITLVGAKFVWYSALAAIVLGHVLAVGVTHFVAQETFGSVRAALHSQLPFLLLMVGYTVVRLWILAQPIVGSPSVGTLRAPSGRLVLEPFTFRELCLELSIGQSIDYEFCSEHPVAFDIHYHQGLAVRYPVQMNSVREQAARFLAPRDQSYCLMWFNRGLAPSRLTYRLFRTS